MVMSPPPPHTGYDVDAQEVGSQRKNWRCGNLKCISLIRVFDGVVGQSPKTRYLETPNIKQPNFQRKQTTHNKTRKTLTAGVNLMAKDVAHAADDVDEVGANRQVGDLPRHHGVDARPTRAGNVHAVGA